LCGKCREDYVIHMRRAGVCDVYVVITAEIDVHEMSVSIYFVSTDKHVQISIDLVLEAVTARTVTLLFSGELITIQGDSNMTETDLCVNLED
jgi:hypothetical protein